MDSSNSSETSGQVVSVDDMDIYYEAVGDGEPLLLLHGFTGLGSDWRLIFTEPLNSYMMVMPDLRGHGRSTNPSGSFTFRQSAHDVFALLDQLEIRRFKAIGLSGGAKTLLHMATQQPDRVEAMVLVSATPYFPKEARAIMDQLTVESHTQEEWEFMRRRHPQGDDQIRMLWEFGNGFKDSYDDMNFTPPYLSRITARTLIVHGDRDPLYPANIGLELYNAIPCSYLWMVPNAGHGPIFGNFASSFVDTSLAFLRGDWDASTPSN